MDNKDFDFDEIDRAVNSATNNTASENDDTTNYDQVKSADNQMDKPVAATPALAGRRSSGQFMDVVHPSSDMRRPPMKTPERPTYQATVPEEPVIPLELEAPEPEKTELPSPTIQSDVWENTKNDNEDADIDRISDDLDSELDKKPEPEDTPDTPFLSDAKVEKRPLGAFSNDSSATTDEPPELLEKKDESLPDELQGKLLTIESNESIATPENQKEIQSVAPVEETPEIEPDTKPVPIVVDNTPKAATSITQQYQEKPSTGDRDSGAIYDTDSYHKALIKPIKKKHSWTLILWIVIIIAAGIGAGVITFYYIMPNL